MWMWMWMAAVRQVTAVTFFYTFYFKEKLKKSREIAIVDAIVDRLSDSRFSANNKALIVYSYRLLTRFPLQAI